MRIPFYRREYDIIMVRHWNALQLRGRSASSGTDWIKIAKPCLQLDGGTIIITTSHNGHSVQLLSVQHPLCQDWPMRRQAPSFELQFSLKRGACFMHSSIKITEAELWRTTYIYLWFHIDYSTETTYCSPGLLSVSIKP